MSLRHARVAVVASAQPHRAVAWPVIERISETLTELGYPNEIVDADEAELARRVADFDVAYLALFGLWGDDGTTQGMLATQGIPYTGSGSKATAVAKDKVLTKTVFRAHGIRTPDFVTVDLLADLDTQARSALELLGSPLVVKPVLGGGSYGITLTRSHQEVVKGIAVAGEYGPVFLEAFIAGRTLTSGVLGAGPDEMVLTPHEVVFHDDRPFLDPVTLYKHGTSDTVYPPRVNDATVHQVQVLAARAHDVLGAHGVSRSDFKVDADGRPWLLELNTMPALSPLSDLPVAAARAGLSFAALVERLLLTALDREWWRP